VGKRQSTLDQILSDPRTVWEEKEITWYGQGKRTVPWCSAIAWWHRAKSPPLPIRWVLIRDPTGKHKPKALLCTDQYCEALTIILTYIKRWSLESTFEEAHAHLGIQTQWSGLIVPLNGPLHCCYAPTVS
jgi:hypothetical protein